MDQHDNVCVCFKVSLHKLTTFMEREQPAVPSQLSQCLNFLRRCHRSCRIGGAVEQNHFRSGSNCLADIFDPNPEVWIRRNLHHVPASQCR